VNFNLGLTEVGRVINGEKLNGGLDQQFSTQRKYIINTMGNLSLDSMFPGFLIRSSNASGCSGSNSSVNGSNAFGGEVLKAGEPAVTCIESTIFIYYVPTGIILQKYLNEIQDWVRNNMKVMNNGA
jgi:hypothetical protein